MVEDNTRPEAELDAAPSGRGANRAWRQRPRLTASMGFQRGRLVPAAPRTLKDGQRHQEDGLPRPGCEPRLRDRP